MINFFKIYKLYIKHGNYLYHVIDKWSVGLNFSNLILAGERFKYLNLEGTDFSNSNLKASDFSYAKGGFSCFRILLILSCVIFSLFFWNLEDYDNQIFLFAHSSIYSSYPFWESVLFIFIPAFIISINCAICLLNCKRKYYNYSIKRYKFLSALRLMMLNLSPVFITLFLYSFIHSLVIFWVLLSTVVKLLSLAIILLVFLANILVIKRAYGCFLKCYTSFANSDLKYSNFKGSFFKNTNFSMADLSYSNLSNGNFRGSNFKGVNFTAANIDGADFTNASFDNVIGFDPSHV